MVGTDAATVTENRELSAAPRDLGRARAISIALSAIALLFLAWVSWSRRWMSDDGFIYLRVVQNLRAGHGPVFNAGERVEAATGPAWVFLLALCDLVTPFRLESIAVVLGIVCTIGGAFAAVMAAYRLQRAPAHAPDDAIWVPFGLAIFVAIPAVWDYATSGLETGLVFLWIGGALWMMAAYFADPAWRTRGVPSALAIVVGFGCLIRPDLLLFTIGFGVVLLLPSVGPRSRWRRVRLVGTMLALPLLYEVFRAGYYGALVPNTAFAKESSKLRVGQGIKYAHDFVGSYWLYIPAVCVAIVLTVVLVRSWRGGQRDQWALIVATVSAGLLDAAYTIAIGGSHMHARLFLPGLFACVAPVAVVRWNTARPIVLGALAWCVVCAVWLRPPTVPQSFVVFGLSPSIQRTGVVDLRMYFVKETGHHNPISVGSHVQAIAPRFRAVLHTPNGKVSAPYGLVGAVAYANGPSVYTFDNLGLADWLTGRLPLNEKLLPDHQKSTGLWFPARFAEIAGTPLARNAVNDAAVRALDCGDLRELREAATAPLSLGRFVHNVWDAFALQSFRLPSDPRAAAVTLCH